MQQLIFIEVEFLATLVGWNQPLACERVDSRFRLACDFARLVNLDNAMLVNSGLRLQCRHNFVDSLHLFSQITYRLRQLIKSNFICHMRIIFNDLMDKNRASREQRKQRLLCRGTACFRHLMAKEIGVIMVKSPTKI